MKTPTILKACLSMVSIVSVLFLAVGCTSTTTQTDKNNTMNVIMKTTMGDIEIQLYPRQAPISVTNFLRYIDSGDYDGGSFYRVVTKDNDNGNPQITVIQGDVKDSNKQWPQIKLETTDKTGVKHLDGTLSMARGGPDTATSSFFICIGAQPSLDFGGKRNADGMGFAAFGKVIKGMDIVKKINQISKTKPVKDAYMKGQMLAEPVIIQRAKRL